MVALAKANQVTPGARSSVIGIVNLGAEHSVTPQTVMVSSDDEGDGEDDLDDDLFGPKSQKRPKIALPNVNPTRTRIWNSSSVAILRSL